MLVYRIEGIIGESLCTDENDRNAVAEMKHKYANRSEVFNNRLDKRGYIFIANISEGIISYCRFLYSAYGNTNDRYCYIRNNFK